MSTTFKATIEHIHQTTSRATVRSHTFLVDRGVSKGGFDLGPAGGEYLLVALGGCFTSHLLAAAGRSHDAAMKNVRVAVTGTLDGRPEKFTTFTIDVSAETADRELAQALISVAGRACQVVTTLRQIATITITYEGSPVELSDMAPVG